MNYEAATRDLIPPSRSAGPSPWNRGTNPPRYESDLLEQCRNVDALLHDAALLAKRGGPELPTEVGRGLLAYYKALADTMVRL